MILEWILKCPDGRRVGIVRLGNQMRKYGDTYKASFVIYQNGEIAHLYLGTSTSDSNLFLKYKNQIKELFLNLRIKEVRWERYSDGKKKQYTYNICRS